MNFSMSFLFVLLLVSLPPLTRPSLAIKRLEDTGITEVKPADIEGKARPSNFEEGDRVRRKYLHEVHSGPNPISNSFPKQKWKTRSRRSP
ncbi:hypothetical protein OIU77_009117 [Salix suchowensis]|uniref:Uncharacterized protein n=2 Tax=Salix TaxID=40685 RepID=A0A9Q0UDZ4_9ROSI|nr:hypothetical protein IMY05_011G0068300 [Salix suchowensis]KAJ6333183.1 hypothetical protein OIU77_009117 [Salix suchowensis]KAJ6728271.1 hypothetical protein OIU74_006346 [Salix koriyanagi]